MLLRFGAHVLGHGLFGQIQQQLPVLGGMIRIIAPFVDNGTPEVDQRLLLICFCERFGLVQFQQRTSISSLQQMCAENSKMDVKRIWIEQQNAIDILLGLVAVAKFHIR